MLSEGDTTRIVDRVINELWEQGNLELADQLIAPGYINHGGLIPDFIRGPEAIKVAASFYRAAFPGLQITIDHLEHQAGLLTFRWTARNRFYPGEVSAWTQDGWGRRSLKGLISVRIAGGRIAESWITWDADGEVRRLLNAAERLPRRSSEYVA